MGKLYSEVSDQHQLFIEAQKLFFVGTATADSRVNISPKGMDSLRVLGGRRVIWLNVTGSGNETAAHIQESDRMTIMFASFEGDPKILRLYGHAKVIHKNDSQWDELYSLLSDVVGARQIFDMTIDMVQTSCGMGVPFFDFVEERDQLNNWAERKGEAGIKEYWLEKNQTSLDSKPTHIKKNS
ncbi:MAG: pyridoxamine 5'-phosphate oxidase family protein [Gammaproteobacteria bacterium]|nr:pyridoxamine 5'-phosphate oxidase family protein [Gammaproteobacteria bacterium]